MKLNSKIKEEITDQFFQGYKFFRDCSKQLGLDYPKLTITHSKINILSELCETGKQFEANGILTYVAIKKEKSYVKLWADNPVNYLQKYSFSHEGAESAYFLERKFIKLPISIYAGEFIGNLAVSELSGGISSMKLKVAKIHSITNTQSLEEAIKESIKLDLPKKILKLSPTLKALTEEQSKEKLISFYKSSIEPYATFYRYTKANDLIIDFLSGKKDPALKFPFLWSLAREEYPWDSTLDELFEAFKELKDELIKDYSNS